MEALQYIYTSWKNGTSTEKGYMIYSRSAGITDSECTAIKDAMQYLAPKELMLNPTPEEIADLFPYAFSYFVLPTGRGCVAQSTYLGRDYSGRFGNYIIYALVFEIDDLPCLPAELFAESYMKTAMTEEELNAPSPVPPLPPLEISEYASVINDDQITEFLYDKEDSMAQLISLILAARDAGVPFYLNDTRENLVLWSAAVQRILPSRLAKKFTFNTYVCDHESMRSPRARDEGLDFHIIGVRPDANYFNYATEYRSNRHMVMDFVDGYMTEGVTPNAYAVAMAASMAFYCEEVDSFREFIDSTSFDRIDGHLQDAYLYYHLIRDDEFDFSEENLKAVISFGSAYCSDSDNSDIGSKLLLKWQDCGWRLSQELLADLWKFVGKYSSYMIFTLYELFTESVYRYADESPETCAKLDSLLQKLKAETPGQYKDYLTYFNSWECVEHLCSYLTGHKKAFTNSFYINGLLQNYLFTAGANESQPIFRMLSVLLSNITSISGSEKQMIDILFATSNTPALFGNVIRSFMSAINTPGQMDQLCCKYIEAAASMPESQQASFERMLLEISEATPLTTRLIAKKIASSKDPENDFWRFYDRQRPRITANPDFALDPIITACLNHVDPKIRDDVAVDIIRRVDSSFIKDNETIKMLTGTVNTCSVKTLSKMGSDFLETVCKLRGKVDKTGIEKIKMVIVGEMMAFNNAQRRRPVNLSEELSRPELSIKMLDKSDYEMYLKNYLDEFFVVVQSASDFSVFAKIFYHQSFFPAFVDDCISAIKKLEKKDPERQIEMLGWICTYIVIAERSDMAAEGMYRPIVRYLRTLDKETVLDIRRAVSEEVPDDRSDYLFDEVNRKEGFAGKLGNLFGKK